METDDELSENNRARCFSLIGNSLCRGQKRGEKDEKCFNSRNWGGGISSFFFFFFLIVVVVVVNLG